jgi:hypothetical protein
VWRSASAADPTRPAAAHSSSCTWQQRRERLLLPLLPSLLLLGMLVLMLAGAVEVLLLPGHILVPRYHLLMGPMEVRRQANIYLHNTAAKHC